MWQANASTNCASCAPAAGDNASLAIGMTGLVMEHGYQGRINEQSRLASEHLALIESIGDPNLTVGLSFAAVYARAERGEWGDMLRWSQTAIDLADGDPSKGNMMLGSPLALALAQRAVARCCLGRPGWGDDMKHGIAMARSADHISYVTAVGYVYWPGIPMGALRPDDHAMGEIDNALRIAERSSDDIALAYARITVSLALVHRQAAAERDRGQKLLAEISELLLHRRGYTVSELPIVNIYLAREKARRGDRNEAIPLMRTAVDDMFGQGLLAWGVPATGVLVETLLDRGTGGDVAEADAAFERLAGAPTDDGSAMRDIWLLRLRALLAQAHGDAATYAHFRDHCRDMARTLGFEGHIAWADAMP